MLLSHIHTHLIKFEYRESICAQFNSSIIACLLGRKLFARVNCILKIFQKIQHFPTMSNILLVYFDSINFFLETINKWHLVFCSSKFGLTNTKIIRALLGNKTTLRITKALGFFFSFPLIVISFPWALLRRSAWILGR